MTNRATTEQLHQAGLEHHRAGRLAEAEACYREVLQREPEHVATLQLIGVLHAQRGEHAQAVELIERAVAANPTEPKWRNNLGISLRHLGRLGEAEQQFLKALELNPGLASVADNLGQTYRGLGRAANALARFRQAVELDPDYASARFNLGCALSGSDPAAAETHLRRAIQLRPGWATAHLQLSSVLLDLKRPAEAITAAKAALEADPQLVEAHMNLGAACRQLGEFDQALAHGQRAAELRPDRPAVHSNLASLLMDLRRFAEAAECAQRAVVLQPELFEAHLNLSDSLQRLGRNDEALAAASAAVRLRPNSAGAHTTHANALLNAGRFAEARAAFERAVQLDPAMPEAHWGRALVLLLEGDFAEGWREYEWRSKLRGGMVISRRLPQPLWLGEDLKGRTILLQAEQGFGDTIQFIRYAPLLAQAGARVLLECQPPLKKLLATVPGIAGVFDTSEPLPAFDCHAPLISLPHRFGTQLHNIPATVPYFALPKDAPFALPEAKGDLKVGVVWAGSTTHKRDFLRSIPIQSFAALLNVPGVAFYSLQVGPRVDDLALLPADQRPIDLSGQLRDFSDTARAMAALDLIISVDTSVVHLAGALGRPVWTLLPLSPDWRWMIGRPDSPWYPTMHLFRQRAPGDWPAVLASVREELAARARG